jgi:hypothetical protein
VAGALFGAEVGAEGTVDSAPDVAVGGESDAGAFPPVGVVDGDPGACCCRLSPPVASMSEPRVVPPDWSEPPTRADTGFCPISSTVVTTAIANPNTATAVAATIAQRRQRRQRGRGRLRRGSRWAGSGGPSPADRSAGDCGDRTRRRPARRSPAWVRRMDSV